MANRWAARMPNPDPKQKPGPKPKEERPAPALPAPAVPGAKSFGSAFATPSSLRKAAEAQPADPAPRPAIATPRPTDRAGEESARVERLVAAAKAELQKMLDARRGEEEEE